MLDFEKIGPCSRLARFAMGDGDAQWRLAITDIASNPLCFRKPLLVKVLTKAAEETTVPVIIAGDFNTPLDSVWFEPYRQKFHHAFEAAGRGHPATWPSFAPILTIDHVWASPDMQITQTTLVSIPSGDHRAVMVDMQPN